jgi:transcription antitermination factor NusA-like protein
MTPWGFLLYLLLISSGSIGTTVLIFFLLFYLNPGILEHWMNIIGPIASRLSTNLPKIKRKVERLRVAYAIQDAVNVICDRINKQAPDVLPHALKIEWIKTSTLTSFIQNGEVIVRLKNHVNQDKNIVDATLIYLKVGFLPRAKECLDITLRKACEFKVASKIFDAKRETGAYGYFVENELKPAINSNAISNQDMQILEDLESVGYFTRVFLSEVKQTGEKLLGTLPTPSIQQELRTFASFLQTIATKGDERVPLSFKGIKVKASVVLVADRDTIYRYGRVPYINRISRCVREGYESIYVSGWGEEFTKDVIAIKKEVERKTVNILRRYDHTVKGQLKGILLVCQANLRHLAIQKELQDEVRGAMVELIPQIKTGEVEIVSIARTKGFGCKIAVRMSTGNNVYRATGACIGEQGELINALKSHLQNEFVGIIPWSDDIREYIINSLYPVKGYQISSIEINEEQLIANIKVNSTDAYQIAIGINGVNVKLAEQLTGWIINVENPDKQVIKQSPEEELRSKLKEYISEIRNNEIEIIGIARITGIGSRVIVRWKVKEGRGLLASLQCYGPNYVNSETILQRLNRERLYFHEWFDEPKKQIMECLYPIKRNEIYSVDLNTDSNTATVVLKDLHSLSATTINQYNLVLAERVTGWRIDIKGKS